MFGCCWVGGVLKWKLVVVMCNLLCLIRCVWSRFWYVRRYLGWCWLCLVLKMKLKWCVWLMIVVMVWLLVCGCGIWGEFIVLCVSCVLVVFG